MVVVVGKCAITAGPHSGAVKSLKLNLAPHGPFRWPACAPPSLIAAAPPGVSGARGTPTSQPGFSAAARGVDKVGARAALPDPPGPKADAGEPERRRAERLAGQEDSRMEPRGWLGAALGRGERERERAARARQARRAHRLRSARRALRTPA